MIIISQDKTRILNFDNVVVLFFKLEREKYAIYADTNTKNDVHIGNYETRERTIQILELIKNRYLQYGSIQNHYGNVANAMTLPRAFEMPEE